jgi:2-iminobutanoate/2-iminopropanoate deaminase
MSGTATEVSEATAGSAPRSTGEQEEMQALGISSAKHGSPRDRGGRPFPIRRGALKHAMHARGVLNEAYDYPRASSFTRGIRFNLGDKTLLLISGTASIDDAGHTTHTGDFRAQLWRTYRNITALLAGEGATWHDVVRTTCYLRDIERDYRDFNEIRTTFFTWLGLDPLPASTGIQARLCREDLLVEIEAMAILEREARPTG